VTGNTVPNLPVSTACLGSFPFFSAQQATMPEWIATARVNQPWGHVQLGSTLRTEVLNDGQYLRQDFLGYAGTLSFDAHPFSGNPGVLGKDDFGGGVAAGSNPGGQIANGAGLATDFGAPINVPGIGVVNPLAQTAGTACFSSAGAFVAASSSGCPAGTTSSTAAWNARDGSQSLPASGIIRGINVRQAYDHLVRTSPTGNYAGWIWYQHWWTDNLRSTIETSGLWTATNTQIVGPGTTNNKALGMAHANLFWSPVAFVDFGVEYAYGHRVTVANFKGDSNTLLGEMRVRF
jgi:hypothetical protein